MNIQAATVVFAPMYIGLSSYFAINFRSRESTLKELIQLCWNTGDQSGEYDDRMSGVADILFSTPGKRVGSLLQHQARTNSILKSVRKLVLYEM